MLSETAIDRETGRQALRLAFAMAISLTIEEARDQPFGFITALFAVQILAKSPNPPSLKQGIGFAIVMALAAHITLMLCGLLLHRPVVYLLVLSLVFGSCFYLQARGKGGPVPQLLLICSAMMPVVAVQSADLAVDFASIMIDGAIGAPLIAWLVYAALPATSSHPAATDASPPESNTEAAVGQALLATVVLMLPFIYFMFRPEEASIVILITCIGIMSQAPGLRGRVVTGLLVGNVIGGVAASLAYGIVTLLPILVMLFLVTLLAGLILAGRLYAPTPLAPVFGVALPTFLVLLGLGLAPTGEGSAAAFVTRVIDVALASLYAVGAIALFSASGRSNAISGPSRSET